jgi:hypothetical protein
VKTVKARWIAFGDIEVDGERYTHDVVIDAGRVSKRSKKASKAYRGRFGHTPLTAKENIPWGGKRLIVGTGASGSLPVLPEVRHEAERRGVELVTEPTKEALGLLDGRPAKDVYAVIHVTC